MSELVEPGGIIILAGILAEQADSVIDSAGCHGLTFTEKRQSGDWVALVCRSE
jgi:ribosomal protein L11 methylase PrmA